MAQVKKSTKPAAPKKTAVKKPAAQAAAKSAAADAAAVQPAPACACYRHAICWKKVLIFALGAVVGIAACRLTCGGKKGRKFGPRPDMPEFVNGCMDTSKIKSPEIAAKLMTKDANGDGCLTKDEVMGDHRPPMDDQGPRKGPRKPRM